MPAAVIMAGFGSALVAMPDLSVTDEQTHPTTANAILTIKSDGTYTASNNPAGQWLAGSTNGSAFDVRATNTGGGSHGGSGFGTWLQINTDRIWNLPRNTPGNNSGIITLEFRPTGGGGTVDTATISYSATVNL